MQAAFLSKEQLRAAFGRKFDVVDVPHVGPVRVGSPSQRQLERFLALHKRQAAGEDVVSALHAIALECVVGADGGRVFTAEEINETLELWSHESIAAISDAVMGLVPKNKPAGADGKTEAPPENPSEPSPSAA